MVCIGPPPGLHPTGETTGDREYGGLWCRCSRAGQLSHVVSPCRATTATRGSLSRPAVKFPTISDDLMSLPQAHGARVASVSRRQSCTNFDGRSGPGGHDLPFASGKFAESKPPPCRGYLWVFDTLDLVNRSCNFSASVWKGIWLLK